MLVVMKAQTDVLFGIHTEKLGIFKGFYEISGNKNCEQPMDIEELLFSLS